MPAEGSGPKQSRVDAAFAELCGPVGESLGYAYMSFWAVLVDGRLDCQSTWQQPAGSLRGVVERDRQIRAAHDTSQRLSRIVVVTRQEIWLRDAAGEPGITAGGAALPVRDGERVLGAVIALGRVAGQLAEDRRGPIRKLCDDLADRLKAA